MRRLIPILALFALVPLGEPAALSLRELQFLEDPHTHAIVHALPARTGAEDRNTRRDECSARTDLTGPGRLVAAKLGQTVQKAGTRIDHVVASPACNAAMTARLLELVPVDIRDWLAPEPRDGTAEDQRDDAIFYLAGLRPLETALLVTHGQNIAMIAGRETVPGEMLIVTVSPLGELTVLYSILP